MAGTSFEMAVAYISIVVKSFEIAGASIIKVDVSFRMADRSFETAGASFSMAIGYLEMATRSFIIVESIFIIVAANSTNFVYNFNPFCGNYKKKLYFDC